MVFVRFFIMCLGFIVAVSCQSYAQEVLSPAPVAVSTPQPEQGALASPHSEADVGVQTPEKQTDPVVKTQALDKPILGPLPPKEPSQGAGADAVQGINTSDFPAYRSVLFTVSEYQLMQDARSVTGFVAPPTSLSEDKNLPPPTPEQREILLSGIVYKKPNDWTIWLNKKIITPHGIPEEILDLKVHKTYIEVKWFDKYTNQIFPIRLRPHQRFNMDARIFLPG